MNRGRKKVREKGRGRDGGGEKRGRKQLRGGMKKRWGKGRID